MSFTAVISNSTAGTAGTGAGFGYSDSGTYDYRPSSVGGGLASCWGAVSLAVGTAAPAGADQKQVGEYK